MAQGDKRKTPIQYSAGKATREKQSSDARKRAARGPEPAKVTPKAKAKTPVDPNKAWRDKQVADILARNDRLKKTMEKRVSAVQNKAAETAARVAGLAAGIMKSSGGEGRSVGTAPGGKSWSEYGKGRAQGVNPLLTPKTASWLNAKPGEGGEGPTVAAKLAFEMASDARTQTVRLERAANDRAFLRRVAKWKPEELEAAAYCIAIYDVTPKTPQIALNLMQSGHRNDNVGVAVREAAGMQVDVQDFFLRNYQVQSKRWVGQLENYPQKDNWADRSIEYGNTRGRIEWLKRWELENEYRANGNVLERGLYHLERARNHAWSFAVRAPVDFGLGLMERFVQELDGAWHTLAVAETDTTWWGARSIEEKDQRIRDAFSAAEAWAAKTSRENDHLSLTDAGAVATAKAIARDYGYTEEQGELLARYFVVNGIKIGEFGREEPDTNAEAFFFGTTDLLQEVFLDYGGAVGALSEAAKLRKLVATGDKLQKATSKMAGLVRHADDLAQAEKSWASLSGIEGAWHRLQLSYWTSRADYLTVASAYGDAGARFSAVTGQFSAVRKAAMEQQIYPRDLPRGVKTVFHYIANPYIASPSAEFAELRRIRMEGDRVIQRLQRGSVQAKEVAAGFDEATRGFSSDDLVMMWLFLRGDDAKNVKGFNRVVDEDEILKLAEDRGGTAGRETMEAFISLNRRVFEDVRQAEIRDVQAFIKRVKRNTVSDETARRLAKEGRPFPKNKLTEEQARDMLAEVASVYYDVKAIDVMEELGDDVLEAIAEINRLWALVDAGKLDETTARFSIEQKVRGTRSLKLGEGRELLIVRATPWGDIAPKASFWRSDGRYFPSGLPSEYRFPGQLDIKSAPVPPYMRHRADEVDMDWVRSVFGTPEAFHESLRGRFVSAQRMRNGLEATSYYLGVLAESGAARAEQLLPSVQLRRLELNLSGVMRLDPKTREFVLRFSSFTDGDPERAAMLQKAWEVMKDPSLTDEARAVLTEQVYKAVGAMYARSAGSMQHVENLMNNVRIQLAGEFTDEDMLRMATEAGMNVGDDVLRAADGPVFVLPAYQFVGLQQFGSSAGFFRSSMLADLVDGKIPDHIVSQMFEEMAFREEIGLDEIDELIRQKAYVVVRVNEGLMPKLIDRDVREVFDIAPEDIYVIERDGLFHAVTGGVPDLEAGSHIAKSQQILDAVTAEAIKRFGALEEVGIDVVQELSDALKGTGFEFGDVLSSQLRKVERVVSMFEASAGVVEAQARVLELERLMEDLDHIATMMGDTRRVGSDVLTELHAEVVGVARLSAQTLRLVATEAERASEAARKAFDDLVEAARFDDVRPIENARGGFSGRVHVGSAASVDDARRKAALLEAQLARIEIENTRPPVVDRSVGLANIDLLDAFAAWVGYRMPGAAGVEFVGYEAGQRGEIWFGERSIALDADIAEAVSQNMPVVDAVKLRAGFGLRLSLRPVVDYLVRLGMSEKDAAAIVVLSHEMGHYADVSPDAIEANRARAALHQTLSSMHVMEMPALPDAYRVHVARVLELKLADKAIQARFEAAGVKVGPGFVRRWMSGRISLDGNDALRSLARSAEAYVRQTVDKDTLRALCDAVAGGRADVGELVAVWDTLEPAAREDAVRSLLYRLTPDERAADEFANGMAVAFAHENGLFDGVAWAARDGMAPGTAADYLTVPRYMLDALEGRAGERLAGIPASYRRRTSRYNGPDLDVGGVKVESARSGGVLNVDTGETSHLLTPDEKTMRWVVDQQYKHFEANYRAAIDEHGFPLTHDVLKAGLRPGGAFDFDAAKDAVTKAVALKLKVARKFVRDATLNGVNQLELPIIAKRKGGSISRYVTADKLPISTEQMRIYQQAVAAGLDPVEELARYMVQSDALKGDALAETFFDIVSSRPHMQPVMLAVRPGVAAGGDIGVNDLFEILEDGTFRALSNERALAQSEEFLSGRAVSPWLAAYDRTHIGQTPREINDVMADVDRAFKAYEVADGKARRAVVLAREAERRAKELAEMASGSDEFSEFVAARRVLEADGPSNPASWLAMDVADWERVFGVDAEELAKWAHNQGHAVRSVATIGMQTPEVVRGVDIVAEAIGGMSYVDRMLFVYGGTAAETLDFAGKDLTAGTKLFRGGAKRAVGHGLREYKAAHQAGLVERLADMAAEVGRITAKDTVSGVQRAVGRLSQQARRDFGLFTRAIDQGTAKVSGMGLSRFYELHADRVADAAAEADMEVRKFLNAVRYRQLEAVRDSIAETRDGLTELVYEMYKMMGLEHVAGVEHLPEDVRDGLQHLIAYKGVRPADWVGRLGLHEKAAGAVKLYDRSMQLYRAFLLMSGGTFLGNMVDIAVKSLVMGMPADKVFDMMKMYWTNIFGTFDDFKAARTAAFKSGDYRAAFSLSPTYSREGLDGLTDVARRFEERYRRIGALGDAVGPTERAARELVRGDLLLSPSGGPGRITHRGLGSYVASELPADPGAVDRGIEFAMDFGMDRVEGVGRQVMLNWAWDELVKEAAIRQFADKRMLIEQMMSLSASQRAAFARDNGLVDVLAWMSKSEHRYYADAERAVNFTHFDYENLSPLQQDLKRMFMFPVFGVNNAKFWATALALRPHWAARYMKAINSNAMQPSFEMASGDKVTLDMRYWFSGNKFYSGGMNNMDGIEDALGLAGLDFVPWLSGILQHTGAVQTMNYRDGIPLLNLLAKVGAMSPFMRDVTGPSGADVPRWIDHLYAQLLKTLLGDSATEQSNLVAQNEHYHRQMLRAAAAHGSPVDGFDFDEAESDVLRNELMTDLVGFLFKVYPKVEYDTSFLGKPSQGWFDRQRKEVYYSAYGDREREMTDAQRFLAASRVASGLADAESEGIPGYMGGARAEARAGWLAAQRLLQERLDARTRVYAHKAEQMEAARAKVVSRHIEGYIALVEYWDAALGRAPQAGPARDELKKRRTAALDAYIRKYPELEEIFGEPGDFREAAYFDYRASYLGAKVDEYLREIPGESYEQRQRRRDRMELESKQRAEEHMRALARGGYDVLPREFPSIRELLDVNKTPLERRVSEFWNTPFGSYAERQRAYRALPVDVRIVLDAYAARRKTEGGSAGFVKRYPALSREFVLRRREARAWWAVYVSLPVASQRRINEARITDGLPPLPEGVGLDAQDIKPTYEGPWSGSYYGVPFELLDEYFAVPDQQGKRAFLASHPELVQAFLRAREYEDMKRAIGRELVLKRFPEVDARAGEWHDELRNHVWRDGQGGVAGVSMSGGNAPETARSRS